MKPLGNEVCNRALRHLLHFGLILHFRRDLLGRLVPVAHLVTLQRFCGELAPMSINLARAKRMLIQENLESYDRLLIRA